MPELNRIFAKLSADIHRVTGLKSTLELIVERQVFERLCWEIKAESLMMQDMQNADDAPEATNKLTLMYYSGEIIVRPSTIKKYRPSESAPTKELIEKLRHYGQLVFNPYPLKDQMNET